MKLLGILLGVLCAAAGLIVLYFLFLTVCALCINPHRTYEKNSRFHRALLYSITAVAMTVCRVHIGVSGLERLPQEGRFLLVSNHRSNFDPIITWHVLKKYQLAFISKPENFKIPWFGRIIRRCCFLPIDRSNPRNAVECVTRAAGLLRSGEVSVAIYPEGTRGGGDVLLPFHNSVFKIAKWAGVPVVTATITGSSDIAKRFPWRSTQVRLEIVGVLDADFIAAHKTNEIGAAVREQMEQSLGCGDESTEAAPDGGQQPLSRK